jgi:hypothetical protein
MTRNPSAASNVGKDIQNPAKLSHKGDKMIPILPI